MYDIGPIFVTKDRVECPWQHELPECCCIAVDAEVPLVGTYARVSLYRIEVEHTSSRKSSDRASVFKGIVSDEKYSYLVDFSRSGDEEPYIAPLILEAGINLTCLKIVRGDTVLIGGSAGYIGVCEFGSPELVSRQTEGHAVESTVTCMAACSKRNCAVCGDDCGGLSLWISTETYERVRCNTVIGGQSTGQSAVNCVQFIPDRDLIAVSTRAQYFLFGLRKSSETGSLELEGIVEINVSSLFGNMGPEASPFKHLPSFGKEGEVDHIHCHCMAFPNSNDVAASRESRQDLGGLKAHTLTPPRDNAGSRDETGGREEHIRPLIIWKMAALTDGIEAGK